jgi:hypothetical protein
MYYTYRGISMSRFSLRLVPSKGGIRPYSGKDIFHDQVKKEKSGHLLHVGKPLDCFRKILDLFLVPGLERLPHAVIDMAFQNNSPALIQR